MSHRDAAMETYNYYRDSRVQASMFSSCWSIDESSDREALISFKYDWVAEQLEEEAIVDLGDSWVAEGRDCTETYRKAQDSADEIERARTRLRDDSMKSEGVEYHWQISAEVKEEMASRYEDLKASRSLAYSERCKLYELAAAEIDKEALLKEKGLTPDGRIRVPMEYEVCGLCRGSGKIVDPNIDCGGITQEEFDEDPDFEEEYFSGRYDITCTRCRGLRVESIPKFPKWLEKMVDDRDQAQMDNIRDECQERAMGC